MKQEQISQELCLEEVQKFLDYCNRCKIIKKSIFGIVKK